MTDKDRNSEITRAIWRETIRDRKLWLNLAKLIAVIGLLAIFTMRIPASITYTEARIDTVAQLQTDYGSRPVYTATGHDGQHYPLVTRSLDAPGPLTEGQTVCLRIQQDRFTGRISARHAPENPTCRPNLHTTK